jgi:hypothetical protein
MNFTNTVTVFGGMQILGCQKLFADKASHCAGDVTKTTKQVLMCITC